MKKIALMAGMAVLMGLGVALAGEAVKHQTLCPVMGGAISKTVYADADGKRVYFCCSGCIATFKKDPAKYIAKLEKDGVTLDKATGEGSPMAACGASCGGKCDN